MRTQFEKKHNSCPLCKSKKIGHRYSITSHESYTFNVDNCCNCNFIFMNPPFDEKTITSLYSDTYYTGNSDYTYFDEREKRKFNNYVWNARIKKIRTWIAHGNFLDIGCSFGGLLECASQHFTTYGVELSSFSAQHAKHKSIIHNGSLESANYTDDFFSVITMIELIEHIKDPLSHLAHCFKLLKKGGVAVIQTADMSALQATEAGEKYHYYLPGHLSYFNAKNLTETLKSIGFSHVKIYRPVEFGLLPKLLKSRGNFTSLHHYIQWIDIIKYHILGYTKKDGTPRTSSMVIYAQK